MGSSMVNAVGTKPMPLISLRFRPRVSMGVVGDDAQGRAITALRYAAHPVADADAAGGQILVRRRNNVD